MPDTPLTPDELAALVAIDSSVGRRRPSMDIGIRLRLPGLIERKAAND